MVNLVEKLRKWWSSLTPTQRMMIYTTIGYLNTMLMLFIWHIVFEKKRK